MMMSLGGMRLVREGLLGLQSSMALLPLAVAGPDAGDTGLGNLLLLRLLRT